MKTCDHCSSLEICVIRIHFDESLKIRNQYDGNLEKDILQAKLYSLLADHCGYFKNEDDNV